MANVTSLLTQVYQQTLQLLRVTTSVANAVVVVVAKAVTERTTNNITRYVLNQKVTQTGHLFLAYSGKSLLLLSICFLHSTPILISLFWVVAIDWRP